MKQKIEQITRTLGEAELFNCELQGSIFSEAFRRGISLNSFAEKYMTGTAAALFDRNQPDVRPSILHGDFISSFIIAILAATGDSLENYSPPDAESKTELSYAFWLGFIYRYEQLLRCVSSKAVFTAFPEEFMRSSYETINGGCKICLPDDAAEICRRLDILLSA